MTPKILISDKIHDKAIEEAKSFAEVDLEFNLTPEELINKIGDYDALIVRSKTKVTREVIEAGKLKIIGRAGVGLDNIDLDATKEKNIKVVNSPEASTLSVAELAIGSLIALMRKIPHGHLSLTEGKWERSKFTGTELYGKTIGIIGFGRIGRETANRARAFGMNVLVYDPHITVEDARESNAELVELDDLVGTSDVISLHLPLTKNTRDLINREMISMMKQNAVIVNIARGGIINEKALYEALRDGRIKGAVLDVYESEPPTESPLLELDNVVLTPHLGASTEEAQINAGKVVVEKIRNFFR